MNNPVGDLPRRAFLLQPPETFGEQSYQEESQAYGAGY
jgi:hypothetical protein